MTTLLERCRAYCERNGHHTSPKDLHDFVLAEIGRGADSRLSDSEPLVLYFANEQDRTELVDAIQEARPGMISRKWP